MSEILNINGENFPRDRASVWQFLGENALANHIHLLFIEDGEVTEDRIWQAEHPELHAKVVGIMSELSYPAHLNLVHIPEADQRAWNEAFLGDLDSSEGFPEAWANE